MRVTKPDIAAFLSELQGAGVQSAQLDDLVHDCFEREGADHANGAACEIEQEAAIDAASSSASAINNEGLMAQVTFLFRAMGPDDAAKAIRDGIEPNQGDRK